MQSSSLHSPLRRTTSCSVATPRSSLPFGICPYTPTEVTRPLWLAFTASAPSSTLTRQGATALKLGFTPSLGRLSNCQATEDDWRGRRPAVPRVSPLKRTVASIPPSTSSPQTTSVNASTTNDSPPSLRFLTYMRVAVTTATTMNAPTMTTPPNAPKRCKYGPHSRPRDEMETKENVVGSTFNAR